MGQYLRNPAFRKYVRYFFVDEVHTAHYAGISRYGLPAFRPTWGRLSEIKALFPSSVPWLGMTATCPPHVEASIQNLGILAADHQTHRITVNRPNTIYAMHQVKGSIDDVNNYRCLLRDIDPITQPRVLVFCRTKGQTRALAKALTEFLPANLRKKGIIRHYHSKMSKRYLRRTHKAFTDPEGACRILFSTSGESTVSLLSSRITLLDTMLPRALIFVMLPLWSITMYLQIYPTAHSAVAEPFASLTRLGYISLSMRHGQPTQTKSV